MKSLALASALLIAGQLIAQTTPSAEVRSFIKVDAPVVALTHVRVVDGTGAPAREDQTLILRGGRIEAMGATSAITLPKDSQVLDLAGHTVLPGQGARPSNG